MNETYCRKINIEIGMCDFFSIITIWVVFRKYLNFIFRLKCILASISTIEGMNQDHGIVDCAE